MHLSSICIYFGASSSLDTWDCCTSSLRLVGWLSSIYDYDYCQQDDVGNDHYSAQDDNVGDDQRCWGMQVLWPKANTGHPALTILTSQIIRCLFTMLTRGFISLSFLNSTSAYLGTWPISEKMREQCDLCEDTFLSASFLNYHMSKQHKESCELGQCKDTFYQANFTIPCHHQQKSSRLNQQINLLQELLDSSW